MSEYKKFQFKIELILNLISVADIQTWATDHLENNNGNQFALELCFLSTEQQIYNYFNQISVEQMLLTYELKKELIHKILLKYTNNPPSITYSQAIVFDIFKRCLELADYINDEELFNFIGQHSDHLYFALEGFGYHPNEVFPNFLNELNDWLTTKLNTNFL